jgi:hypothetical protein
MSEEQSFSGFMPMISQISSSTENTMMNTEGEIMKAHEFKVTTRDNKDYVFSIENVDLMRLYFLIMKINNS